MANSEDYLDGLLNSITKAKSENESAVQSEAMARRQRIERRTRLSADDDFMSANGLDEFEPVTSSRKNLHHFLSESDYLKQKSPACSFLCPGERRLKCVLLLGLPVPPV